MHKYRKSYSQRSELRIPSATNAPTDVEKEYLVEVLVVTAAALVLVVVVLAVLVVLVVAVVVDLI